MGEWGGVIWADMGYCMLIELELRATNLVARISDKRMKPLRIIRGGRTLMGLSKLIVTRNGMRRQRDFRCDC